MGVLFNSVVVLEHACIVVLRSIGSRCDVFVQNQYLQKSLNLSLLSAAFGTGVSHVQ